MDLVLSTRPNKQQANTMLAAIQKQRYFSRTTVLEALKERLNATRSNEAVAVSTVERADTD